MKRRNFIQLIIATVSGTAAASAPRQEITREKLKLLETRVAGFQFYEGEQLFDQIQPNQPLTLRREVSNRQDKNAVALYWQGHKLGYIPRTDNVSIAQMIDRGEELSSHIESLQLSSNLWERVGLVVSCQV